MRWYLDGVLISTDYMTAPSADSESGGMIGARPGFGGFRPRRGADLGETHRGHGGGRMLPEEHAGPGAHGLPTAKGVNLDDVHPEMLARMKAAYDAAPESAKKSFSVISGYRTREQQEAAYWRYTHGQGGIAARPGRSRHEHGQALDIHDPTGWFHRHGHEYGLHWPVHGDPGHTQMDPSFGRRVSGPDQGPGGVRGSMFDDTRTASGRSAAAEAGIALPSGGRMGDKYKITTPDGRTFIAPLIDRGPAAWTGRGVDISRPLAEQMGYGKNFPTDKHFKVERYDSEGERSPKPQSSLPGQVMSDADPDPIRPGQQYASNEDQLRATMTHHAEQPNPARPVIDAAKAFATGGLQGVANQQGVATPEWSQRAGEVLSSPEANAAIGLFGGPLAKGADLAALARAKSMAEAGTHPTNIWKDTGWFQGPDNKWRFEIPDTNAQWLRSPKRGSTDTMKDVLSHPELYAAYPELADIWAEPIRKGTSTLGEYYPSDHSYRGGIRIQNKIADPRSTALHELQHAIQQREGFDPGASSRIGWDKYWRNPGEVEARNVQERLKMTPEERRNVPPRSKPEE